MVNMQIANIDFGLKRWIKIQALIDIQDKNLFLTQAQYNHSSLHLKYILHHYVEQKNSVLKPPV